MSSSSSPVSSRHVASPSLVFSCSIFFSFYFFIPCGGGGRNLYLFIVYKLVYYMAAWSIIPFPVFALIGEEKRGVEIYPVSTGGIVIAQCDLV